MPKTLPVIDMSAPIRCAPVSAEPMDDAAALEVALRLKALADPVRIKLMSILLTTSEGEVCTCDLAAAVKLSEPTVSHHLGQLKKAGMVRAQRRGMNVFYRAHTDAVQALRQVLDPCCCR
jgi:DNA-binding transcriptional ArsR family regulator